MGALWQGGVPKPDWIDQWHLNQGQFIDIKLQNDPINNLFLLWNVREICRTLSYVHAYCGKENSTKWDLMWTIG